jgi:hypothetical protein
MDRGDIEKIGLKAEPGAGLPTKAPCFTVTNLPKHLKAEICPVHSQYIYRLERDGDPFRYEQNGGLQTPEASLEALKKLLMWDPV